MTQNNRIVGTWWPSDNPENRVPGDLLLNERKLELNGHFEDSLNSTAHKKGNPKIHYPVQNGSIIGVSRSGSKKFTLEYFDNPSSIMTMNTTHGHRADTYDLSNIIEGEHFNDFSNLSFQQYLIEYPNLLAWAGDGVISMRYRQYPSINIEIGRPKETLIYTGDNFSLFVATGLGHLSMYPLDDVHISQKCKIKIKSSKSLDLAAFHSIRRHLERFLSISMGVDVLPTKIEALTKEDNHENYVTLHTKPGVQADQQKLTCHDMNFTFTDIQESSQAIFNEWFTRQSLYTDVFDLLSMIISNDQKNINNFFRDTASAIEGYAGIKYSESINSGRAVKLLNEQLPKAKRIIKATDYDRIRVTRNKLSHIKIREKDNKYVMNDTEKYIHAIKMTFLLQYSLLADLRVEKSLQEKFYNKHY